MKNIGPSMDPCGQWWIFKFKGPRQEFLKTDVL